MSAVCRLPYPSQSQCSLHSRQAGNHERPAFVHVVALVLITMLPTAVPWVNTVFKSALEAAGELGSSLSFARCSVSDQSQITVASHSAVAVQPAADRSLEMRCSHPVPVCTLPSSLDVLRDFLTAKVKGCSALAMPFLMPHWPEWLLHPSAMSCLVPAYGYTSGDDSSKVVLFSRLSEETSSSTRLPYFRL